MDAKEPPSLIFIQQGDEKLRKNTTEAAAIGPSPIGPCMQIKTEPEFIDVDNINMKYICKSVKSEEDPLSNDTGYNEIIKVEENNDFQISKEEEDTQLGIGIADRFQNPFISLGTVQDNKWSPEHQRKYSFNGVENSSHETDKGESSVNFVEGEKNCHPVCSPVAIKGVKRNKLICRECQSTFDLPSCLERHMRTHVGEIKECSTALNGKVKEEDDVEKLIKIHRYKKSFSCDESERPFSCKECGKTFSRSKNLSQHMRVHTGFKCSFCPKSFSNRGALGSHLWTHMGKKSFPFKTDMMHTEKFSFDDCSSVAAKSSSTSYRKIHTFICKECGKTFSQSQLLSEHIKSHTRDWPPYVCKECGKSFSAKSSLAIHLRIHTGEKPFSCGECGKSFSDSGGLVSHVRIHTGERPFSCNKCPKSFTQAGSLKNHMRIHTGEKPFSCTECPKSFSQAGHLQSHIRVHHPYIYS